MTNQNTQFEKAVDLLKSFRDDYQLDPNHPEHCGFINVGRDILAADQAPTWDYIFDNLPVFQFVASELGLTTESGWGVDETVFVKI